MQASPLNSAGAALFVVPAVRGTSTSRRTMAAPCGLPVQRPASPAGTPDLIALVVVAMPLRTVPAAGELPPVIRVAGRAGGPGQLDIEPRSSPW